MNITRRTATFGLMASTLAACGGTARLATTPTRAAEAAFPAVPNAGWDAWVASYKSRAAARGISQGTVTAAFQGAGYLPGVIERDRNQTEFTRTLEDYLAIAASPERIATGRAKLGQLASTMAAIEARFGVERQVFTAIWGLESQYGERRGSVPVVSAVSTLAYEGRRAAFFEEQLDAALRILQRGDTTPGQMTGSWAGAMGHTQFIPTSFLSLAVDFDGDGRRDIWSEDPTDGIASAAAYLQNANWRRGQPWGVEVRLPAGFNTGLTGRSTTRATGSWNGLGITGTDGAPVPDHGNASVIIPQGPQGPAFMVFANFRSILRYNNAENYAIGVGHLSDRLIGGAAIQARFPPDANGLTLNDREALQQRLTARGFDTQGADGVVGNNTRAAISAYQQANGLPVTGEPSRALLDAL